GDVVVVGLGGSVALYVIDHHPETLRKLVDLLQGSDFAGVIFSRVPLEGTFPLDQVRINTTNPAPDLVVSMRWTADLNDYGAPGMIIGENGTKGKGTHASLSPFDMHNTLVAAGPDFRRDMVDEMHTGNADVPPTILYILGATPAAPMDGWGLSAALPTGPGSPPDPDPKSSEASGHV